MVSIERMRERGVGGDLLFFVGEIFVNRILRLKFRTSYMQSLCSTSELHPWLMRGSYCSVTVVTSW